MQRVWITKMLGVLLACSGVGLYTASALALEGMNGYVCMNKSCDWFVWDGNVYYTADGTAITVRNKPYTVCVASESDESPICMLFEGGLCSRTEPVADGKCWGTMTVLPTPPGGEPDVRLCYYVTWPCGG